MSQVQYFRPNTRSRVIASLVCAPLAVLTLLTLGTPGTAQAEQSITVTLLNGTSQSGELVALSPEQIQLRSESGPQAIAADTVMQVEFNRSTETPDDEKTIAITAGDQSQFKATSLISDGTTATIESRSFGSLSIPVRQLNNIRLSVLDDKISTSWEDLRTRNTRDDLLVIRKQDVLDFASGSIGNITADAVTMLVRNKELSAPRDRIFGIIFASRSAPTGRKISVRTSSGDTLQADGVELKESGLQVQSASLGTIEIPLSLVSSINFGGGRLRFLADLPFDSSESKAPDAKSSIPWFVSKNSPAGSGGNGVLRIGQKEFKRGLWLHSGAVLRYRLNREYTRLRATAGFELTHVTRMPRFNPKVTLVVMGDGKELFKQEFVWNDPPQVLDLDLTDVRDLSVRIDSLGAANGILEHFALGDAQVLQ